MDRPTPPRLTLGADVFTSGDLAGLWGVAPRTVCKWADAGLLGGYRLPRPGGRPGGDRRFPRAAVVAFARGHGLPLPAGFAGPEVTP